MLLFKQLVPFWDWEDAADEMKQLAPVWSSKLRHISLRDMERARDLYRTRVYERYSTQSGGREIENEIARVRQIDPLIMDRPLEMPNGSEASKPILSDVTRRCDIWLLRDVREIINQ